MLEQLDVRQRAMITTRDFQWSWQGQHLALGLDEAGDGAPVLLLPALNSISTQWRLRLLLATLTPAMMAYAYDSIQVRSGSGAIRTRHQEIFCRPITGRIAANIAKRPILLRRDSRAVVALVYNHHKCSTRRRDTWSQRQSPGTRAGRATFFGCLK